MIQGTQNQDIQLQPKARRFSKGNLLALGFTFAVSAISYGLWSASSAQASLVIPKNQVQLATVERGSFTRDLSVQGRIVAANAPTLISQEAGQIQYLKQPGEAVTLGDLLAVVSSPQLENELKQQQATLASMESDFERATLLARELQLDMEQIQNTAQVNLLAAQRELARAEQSIKVGVIRQLDYDVAKDKLVQAELEFDHAKRKVSLASDKLQFEKKSGAAALQRQTLVVAELERKQAALHITAPVTGQVGNWLVEQHAHVLAGAPLITVIDLSQYEAELAIQESYIRDLAVGMPVEVNLGNQQLKGQLSHISPEVKDNLVTARVRFSQNDSTSLRQNQRLSARVIIEQKDNVLRIRRGDFVASGASRIAYQVNQDLAVKTPVVLGASSVQYVEILQGAKEGDQWVISNLDEFKQQDRVQLN
ncbi:MULTISPECIES: efflux RND transporter periplasmic adaptor subunit [Rheinheimera]|uniref:Efflux RND transporter periplasmic adaptor subunit n=1 Tax=Rheinheimera marina TaxID=1774958 RepID=A0ABV9JL44_9GAMM